LPRGYLAALASQSDRPISSIDGAIEGLICRGQLQGTSQALPRLR
jgi:hypothetical protein